MQPNKNSLKKNGWVNIRNIAPLVLLFLSDIISMIIVIKKEAFDPVLFFVMFAISLCMDSVAIFFVVKYFIKPLKRLNANILALGNEKFTNLAGPPELMFDRLVEVISSETTANMLMVQAEMHALQNQINPHFLYNTLEVIRSQAISREVYEIAEMTEALATLFRYGIGRPGKMATLAEELNNVRDYLTIQKYRFGAKINVDWHIEDEGDNIMECLLPLLTIQPIVENGIHHGLESKVGKGTLSIRASLTHNKLMVTVTDDGIGIPEDKLNEILKALRETSKLSSILKKNPDYEGAGIALTNVNQRLKFYFGGEYGLSIESTVGCGTSVHITVPKT